MRTSNLVETCREYCTGCGLCGSVLGKQFSEDDKHFIYPDLTEDDYDFCALVCPAAGTAVNQYATGTIFGKISSCCLGWSSEESIRFSASSGGVTTAACVYLLEHGMVDGVIQTTKDPDDYRKTVTVVSKTKEDIINCAGSRYTASSPLLHICDCVEPGKRYAFVGKPCDVSALRMYMNQGNAEWANQIDYLFSFFCAGQPSLKANSKLLAALGCSDVSELESLTYRGNGWPGSVKAVFRNGQVKEMEYEKSWMSILGRDVRKCCRFCADGTGEMADISSGDAWYLTQDGKPDLTEHPGRNVIFARTETGDRLLKELIESGAICTEEYDIETNELKKSQPYHYNRKASLGSLKLAMRLCGRRFPLYSRKKLKMFSRGYPLKNKILRCAGTIKRVWSKSI